VGDAAGDAGDRVTVAADGDGVSDGVFVVCGFEEGYDGLRHGALAGHVEAVARPDLGQRGGEVILKGGFDVIPYFIFIFARPGKKDGDGCSLRAFDTFRVVVRYFGTALCFG